ncbi:MAG: DNA mismatch repair protein MutS [Candidatus Electronema aureum]|uniref:DNA mismatch repair protein MutS n=1 Tax=Candidatus Electronema aureum TaxID=2005002 RepID=A0A521G156_9BACT|nr:MAG: DNA mismatch repair protein MutS [Candidatus Electronema aureum]
MELDTDNSIYTITPSTSTPSPRAVATDTSSASPATLKITPMLRQYLEIKEQHPGTILFYRMGDFYEMFFEDAETASRVLGITLTSRSREDAPQVPMCGVPYHALTGYLGKMVKAGYRVALCEQVEDPKQAKGIVRREVVRVVSPGVTTDEQLLDEKSNTFVCALTASRRGQKLLAVGLSFLDVSTGNFLISELPLSQGRCEPVIDEITRMQPAELLLAEDEEGSLAALTETLRSLLPGLCVTKRQPAQFEPHQALTTLLEHFQVSSLAGFGCDGMEEGIRAAGGLLAYIQETQKTDLAYIRQLRLLSRSGFLIIDESSRRNLELTETALGGRRQGSLLSVLDLTSTPMGARLLRQRLLFPLQDKARIEQRLEAVAALVSDSLRRREMQEQLKGIYDMERLCSRLVLGHGNARDMAALKLSLACLPELKRLLLNSAGGLLQEIGIELDPLFDLHDLIHRAIRDDAPVTLREGDLIREGFHAELDELLHLLRDGKQLVANLEAKERQRSGIAKLKVGYNRVFGYYFEVSRAQQKSELPDDYIRKQTLANAERFITPELKELEERIATAQDKRLTLEYELFIQIREQIAAAAERLLKTAHAIARADFVVSLAEAAARYQYVRPAITDNRAIYIVEGRHPVIERSMEAGRFVPNDVLLDQDAHELLIITGPNMAGKSTVLRQTALIVLMAHIGSFVPAAQAEICLVDRIFTRVGAMDDLRRGQSTFMVEMNETANILNNATERSLVILDEIGRGTSTYDGLAIAWAVAEELADKNGRGVKTMFATHYHELTDLATTHPRIQNYSIAVREHGGSIIFLHKLVKGAASRSYGIQVAALAGVPKQVVQRAQEILTNIERGEFTPAGEPSIAVSTKKKAQSQPCQLSLFQPKDDALRKMLKEVDPDALSPRQAQELVYELVEEAMRRG